MKQTTNFVTLCRLSNILYISKICLQALLLYILYIHSTWNQSKCKMELPVRNLIGCLYNLYQAPRRTRHLRYICINFYTQPIKMLIPDILNAIWLVACTICTRLVVELEIGTPNKPWGGPFNNSLWTLVYT